MKLLASQCDMILVLIFIYFFGNFVYCFMTNEIMRLGKESTGRFLLNLYMYCIYINT